MHSACQNPENLRPRWGYPRAVVSTGNCRRSLASRVLQPRDCCLPRMRPVGSRTRFHEYAVGRRQVQAPIRKTAVRRIAALLFGPTAVVSQQHSKRCGACRNRRAYRVNASRRVVSRLHRSGRRGARAIFLRRHRDNQQRQKPPPASPQRNPAQATWRFAATIRISSFPALSVWGVRSRLPVRKEPFYCGACLTSSLFLF